MPINDQIPPASDIDPASDAPDSVAALLRADASLAETGNADSSQAPTDMPMLTALRASVWQPMRTPLNPPPWVRRFSRIAAWTGITFYFVLALVVLSLRYGVLPRIENYHATIVSATSQALGVKVEVGAIEAHWSGFRPVLMLHRVVVYDHEQRPALRLPEVSGTLGWSSLIALEPRLHRLQIDAPDVALWRTADGIIYVAGFAIDPNKPSDDKALEWLLAQGQIIIRNAHVRWDDGLRHAPPLALSNIQFVLRKSSLRHDFYISADAPSTVLTNPAATTTASTVPLNLRGHFESPFFSRHRSDYRDWSGELYTQFNALDLAAWHAYVDYPIEIERGTGALRAWLKFSPTRNINGRETRLPELTADLYLQNLTTRLRADLPLLQLGLASGRIAVKQMADGEELQLQQFRMNTLAGPISTSPVGGAKGVSNTLVEVHVPATDLTATHHIALKNSPERGSLKANQLDLEALAAIAERLPLAPRVREALADYAPRGRLLDLALTWQGSVNAITQYEVAGNFENLSVASHASTPATLPSANAIAAIENRPGFEHLSGRIKANQNAGALILASHAASISLPGVFAEPLIALDKLDATLEWQIDGQNLRVQIAQFSFENADAAASGAATYALARQPLNAAVAVNHGHPDVGTLDLKGRFTRAEANQVYRYLPLTIPAQTRDYLQRSLLSGRAENVDFSVVGPLNEFPFTKPPKALASANKDVVKKREFSIAGKLRDITMNYAPHPVVAGAVNNTPVQPPLWPLIDHIDGQLLIDKQRLEVKADSARVFGVALEKVDVVLPDLENAHTVLQVTGAGNGPLQDYVRFTNASPIALLIDHLTEATRASGTAKLALKLDLPLADMEHSKVAGSLTFQNNDLALLNDLPIFQKLNGRFDFSDRGIALHGITAQFVGGPMKLEATTRADGMIEMRGDGMANLQNIRNTPGSLGGNDFAEQLVKYLSGAGRYNVSLNLRTRSETATNPASNPPAILIESNLAGIGINLPEPLKKVPGESWPLRVELHAPVNAKKPIPGVAEPLSAPPELLNVHLGTIFNAAFERRRGASGDMEINRAAYGINEAAVLTDATAYANVNLKTLDLDAWTSTMEQIGQGSSVNTNVNANTNTNAKAPTKFSANNYLPDVFAIRAGHLHVAEKNFANVIIAASQLPTTGGAANESTWQANLDAEQVSGYVTWHQGAGQDRFTARLARLTIPQSEAAASDLNSLLDAKPKQLPALDIVADRFELSGKKLGRLELLAVNTGTGKGSQEWQLQKLNLVNDDARFEAKGVWGTDSANANNAANAASKQRTRMSFTLTASNVGKLMDRLNMKDTVRNGTALLTGDVAWRGSPININYGSLDGSMRLEADKGQFLKADPGIAKLLGVLSLQGLQRRLIFDFRDLVSEGFAFDSIRANVAVDKGMATTKDFKMRGVQATVLIEGSTDLDRETQNLHVLVLPEINAGGASLGYAALANPAIGLATFVAQYLLHDPLSRAFSLEYNVTGSWADPAIHKINGKAAADETGAAPAPATPAAAPTSTSEQEPAVPPSTPSSSTSNPAPSPVPSVSP